MPDRSASRTRVAAFALICLLAVFARGRSAIAAGSDGDFTKANKSLFLSAAAGAAAMTSTRRRAVRISPPKWQRLRPLWRGE